MDATNWRAEQAISFDVVLRKVGWQPHLGRRWAQSVLMSVWRIAGSAVYCGAAR